MIERSFFERDPLTCARELIGCELVWLGCAGVIVETEAYSAVDDEASHIFMRPSIRKFAEIHDPGTAYVYLNYGVHWLLNVLVKGGREDGFVLFRALEPTKGIEKMMERRGVTKIAHLCSGPGKLTQALGVDGRDNLRDLCVGGRRGFRQLATEPGRAAEVVADLRVGITRSAHHPWRFLARDSSFVSVGHGKVRASGKRSG